MPDKAAMGKAAAAAGAELIRRALADRGAANIIVATGASQFEMLSALVQEPNLNWNVSVSGTTPYQPVQIRLFLESGGR